MTRREAWLLAAVVGVAAIVRFATLDHQSLDHDEAVTAIRVLHPGLGDTLSVVSHLERSPPLYYVLVWLWSKLFGIGEVGLRSMSALAGTLTIPAVYLAARRLSSRRAGLIAAALAALSPYLVWYSQEARSYALLVLFAAWALYLFARCLDDPSRRNLALWAAASALALCSHYFAVFLIVPQAIWLVREHWPSRAPVVAVGAIGAVGLALAPFAIGQQSGHANSLAGVPLARRALQAGVELVAGQEPGPFAGSRAVDLLQLAAVVVAAALCLLALLLLRSATRPQRRAAAVAAAIGAFAIAAPFALALVGLDFVDPRNLIGALVPLLVAAGVALSCAGSGRRGPLGALAGVATFAAVLVAINVSAQMQRPDWRGAVAAMGRIRGPTALIVTKNADDPMAYYLGAQELKRRFYPSANVREIITLSKAADVTAPGGSFTLAEQRGLAPCCVLRVFRAPRPATITPGDVAGARLHESQKELLAGVPRVVVGGHESGPPARAP